MYLTTTFSHPYREDDRVIEITDGHDAEQFGRIVESLKSLGWSVIETLIDDDYYDIPLNSLSAVASALLDAHDIGVVIAFGEIFGWHNASVFEDGRWGQRDYEDAFQGVYDSVADFAESFVKDCYSLEIPDFVSIDWEETGNTLMQGNESYEYDGSLYIFHSNW